MTAPMSPGRRAAIERRIAHWEGCGAPDVPLPIRTARAMLAEIDRLKAALETAHEAHERTKSNLGNVVVERDLARQAIGAAADDASRSKP